MNTPRFHCPLPIHTGDNVNLPAGAARHVQVLRKQPGDSLILFSGSAQGGEFEATIEHMGRNDVRVVIGAHNTIEREPVNQVHLAIGVPANDRMDWLVEKATELGVNSIQALMTERSVLRLSGERAEKKRIHWQAIAIAACEQCGRNQIPTIHPVMSLQNWLSDFPNSADDSMPISNKLLLSLQPESIPIKSQRHTEKSAQQFIFLSGPEGGFSLSEESAALNKGFTPISLGNRVLRAETAALVAMAALTIE
ncbi:MAG TPA: 16S rRNA (uracil(1498)-N(3))-methyltransferase [Burkholderiaceae bacterium]|nr:16S rRNA (uracil(1498)-N(3))-methyltransferase [Burkholderiaceae bacterium]